tara:strand:+ start:47 stop:760 length:714 start_codon:yes stop_codon:yes gene_type:complete
MPLTKVTGKGISDLDELGVGTTSPRSVNNYSFLTINNSSGAAIDFELGEALKTTMTQSSGQFEINTSANLPMIFKTNNSERLRILAGGGLTFNGDTATANAIDDYEEGNWTPTLTSTSGVTKTAGTANLGRYTKIGNLVNVTGTVAWNGTETLSGLVAVGGLPFASVNTNAYRSSAAMGASDQVVMPSNYQNGLAMSLDQNATKIWVVARSTTSFTHYPTIGNTGAIYGINCSYRTA